MNRKYAKSLTISTPDGNQIINPKDIFGKDAEYICKIMYMLKDEENEVKQLKARAFKVAKRHHVFLKWCNLDQWEIYRDDFLYAKVQL